MEMKIHSFNLISKLVYTLQKHLMLMKWENECNYVGKSWGFKSFSCTRSIQRLKFVITQHKIFLQKLKRNPLSLLPNLHNSYIHERLIECLEERDLHEEISISSLLFICVSFSFMCLSIFVYLHSILLTSGMTNFYNTTQKVSGATSSSSMLCYNYQGQQWLDCYIHF